VILLLQVASRLLLTYPPMLAAAGVVVALIPGAPAMPIDPEAALAIFIAPALLDAAFDFPHWSGSAFDGRLRPIADGTNGYPVANR
jgi:monovalent cation/hydrogen antiporter